MTQWLKQSTSVAIQFGPFLDATNAVDLETGLATAMDNVTTGIRISKNGGDITARNATVTATTYDEMGLYVVTLDATDTGTLGTLKIIFEEAATCLPVWQDFMIVPANVWDSMFGADKLDVNVAEISDDGPAADNLETMLDGTGGNILSLGQLLVSNSGGTAAIFESTGGGGTGVYCAGDGAGYGAEYVGGATSHGFRLTGGATSGDGIKVTTTSGHGVNIAATGVSMHGMTVTGGTGGTSDGMVLIAGTGGVDLRSDITGSITGNLSGSVGSVTATVTADVDTIKTQTVTCAAGVTINPSVGAATIQPTVTQLDARTLVAASYATPTNITAGTITTVTNLTNAPTSGDLTAAMKTSVNTEIVDALNTDTITLPGQTAPPLTPTHREAVGWLYKVMRNRKDQSATLWQLYADDESTVDAKATVSDSGSLAIVQEIVTGP